MLFALFESALKLLLVDVRKNEQLLYCAVYLLFEGLDMSSLQVHIVPGWLVVMR